MNHTELNVKMVLSRWYLSIKNFDTILNSLTDETLNNEIVPGKNRGIYLLGHLIAVHDDMLIILNMGKKLYPELNEPFIMQADKSVNQIPSAAELRAYWINQNKAIQEKFDNIKPEEWFEKHMAISEEDFIQEPHRNKLNVIITRIAHLEYHTGQIKLL